jgi:hypothetical protein
MSLSDILAIGAPAESGKKKELFYEKEEKAPKPEKGAGVFGEDNTNDFEDNDAMSKIQSMFGPIVANANTTTTTTTTGGAKKRGRPKKGAVVVEPIPQTKTVSFLTPDAPIQHINNEQSASIIAPPVASTPLFSSKNFQAETFGELDSKIATNTATKSKFNKRGALKGDVKWAVEQLTQARRTLSPEETRKIRLAEEINKYYMRFPEVLGHAEKKPKDVTKVSLKELEEEKRDIKQRLAEPHSFTLTEDVFFAGIEMFERIYMRRFYGTKNDFIKFDIGGLAEHLKGNPEYIRPELNELSIEFADYLALGPFNRLVLKTMKAASETHLKNTCGDAKNVITKYAEKL